MNQNNRKFFMAFLLFTSGLTSTAFSWQEYHGGNDIVVEFHQLSLSLLDELIDVPANSGSVQNLKPSLDWVKFTLTTDKLILNNEEKTILVQKNTADCTSSTKACEIVINVKKWNKLSIKTKEMLVLHELLNLSALTEVNHFTDDQYRTSRVLYDHILKNRVIKAKGFNPYSYILSDFKKCSIKNFLYAKDLIDTTEYANSDELKIASKYFCKEVTDLIQKYAQILAPATKGDLPVNVKIYQTRNGTDYLITPFEAEGFNYGYISETVFTFFGNADSGVKPIYRCRGSAGHFVSSFANCENQTVEGILAYLSVSNNSVGTLRPIYRIKTSTGNYLISYDSTEGFSKGCILDGLLGYGF